MQIIVSKNVGFCFGVKIAIQTAYKEAKIKKIVTYGQLIHNKYAIKELEKNNIYCIDNLDEIDGETVLLRSHGVVPDIYETLKKKQIKYIDCTCPYVKKIHKIVEENFKNGNKIIILGNIEHPEIVGIMGYVNNDCIVIKNYDHIKNIDFRDNNYSLVSQTTFDVEEFDKIITDLNKKIKNLTIFNTICNATKKRQKEVEELSKIVDKMIVIGDTKSSNSRKLYEISKKNCEKTFFIERIVDLQLNIFSAGDKIGITTGASTPPAIIKEAISNMNSINDEKMSFEELLNQSFVTLHTGDIVTGKVIRVYDNEIYVNLGYKSDGIISKDEFSEDPNVDLRKEFSQGDDIEVMIIKINDGDGNILLSRKRVENQKNIVEIEKAFNEKKTVKGKIIEKVKGGLIALVYGLRVFVPSSQISNKFVENLDKLIGNEYDFNIIEFEPAKRRIIIGRKEIVQNQEQEKRAKVLKDLEIGKQVKGVVRRIVNYGAFIDLGGVDGLLHISQMSWAKITDISDILKEGQEVVATVIELDKEKAKISLSMKDEKKNPWNEIQTMYSVGDVVKSKVVRVLNFGIFVELCEGIDALIHISQLSNDRVQNPQTMFKIGDSVSAKIIGIDKDNKKVSLSIKELES